MIDMNIKEIKELFSQIGIIVKDADMNEDENMANIYIEVSSTGIYTIEGIENIIKKIKYLQSTLIGERLIDDITIGDLYQGTWRILIHFKTEENSK